MTNLPQPPARPATRYRGLLFIWAAQLMSIGVFALLTFIIKVPYDPGAATLRFRVLDVVGGATLALSFVLKYMLLRRAHLLQRPDYVTSAYVVAFALCELTALCGLVNYFITGVPIVLLFLLAVVGLLLHFPRRAHLHAVAPTLAQPGLDSTLR